MQDKINYDNYKILFDGELMAQGTMTHGSLLDFYKVITDFSLEEVVKKQRDFDELGKYLDYNFSQYAKPLEFIDCLYSRYKPFWINSVDFIPLIGNLKTGIQSMVTEYVINWIIKKIESSSIGTYSDTAMGYQIREIYDEIQAKKGGLITSSNILPITISTPKGYDLGYTVEQLETLHTKLIEGNFLDRNTQLEHFKNAFNGEVLAEEFEPLKWLKSYYASIFVYEYIGHKTPWQIVERVFDNGTSNSLKNAYNPKSLTLSDNQKNAKQSLDKIFKSLP